MRAALLGWWPALVPYGVTPLNVHLFSPAELTGFLESIKDKQWRGR